MQFQLIILLALGLIAQAAAAPAFRDFMGINGHTVQFKPELYAPVASLARDYHPVEWDLGKDSDFKTHFPSARNGVDWQHVYGSWQKRGWRVDACLMFESLKRDQWKNLAADSRVYAEAFARAFGPSSATPLVESVEIGNEPGKYSDEDYRTIFENMARGFRAGDAKLKIVTCNLTTGKSHPYAKSVDCIAGLENLCDVLNIHSYAELQGWPTWARSYPEDPRLKAFIPDITNLCRWRDQHAPGKPIWLTEFGYDSSTKQPDPKTEFKQWTGITDEQQAQWIVRSWLLLATLPIDRAYLYFFNDTDQPQVHGASGLTRNFQPKPSYYAAAHLQKTLGDYRFEKKEQMGSSTVAHFAHATDFTKKIDVAWLPTGNKGTATIRLPGKIKSAERMPLDANGPVKVSLQNNAVEVTESPTYIVLDPN